MAEVADAISDTLEHEKDSSLGSIVAILVAVTATVMALGNIKDGNIVQAMTAAQSKAVDTWTQYQAESTKKHIIETARDELSFRMESGEVTDEAVKAKLVSKLNEYDSQVQKYEKSKAELAASAQELEAEYNRLNMHDDQFDMAEAFLTLGITLYGITALTKKRWLLGFGIGLTALGVTLTLAGFLRWAIHPDFLASWLG